MQEALIEKTSATDKGCRPAYRTPEIQRVDLALEETLSAGCKVWGVGSTCGDFSSSTSDDGS